MDNETTPEPAPEPAPEPDILRRRGTWIVIAGVLALGLIARLLLLPPAPPAPPAYFDIPAFTLISQEGRPFGSADLKGKVWIAGFFFTRCPTICPILLQRQADVNRRTEDLGDALHLVTFSIDPDHDTPQAMREHAAARGLDLRRWTLVTGPTETIQQLVRDGFKEYLKAGVDVPPEEVVHSVRFFLVDGQGRVRGLYDATIDDEIERLARDAERIVRHPEEPPAEL